MALTGVPAYVIPGGDRVPVAPERSDLAREIDTNGDRELSRTEMIRYLSRPEVDIWRPGAARDDNTVYKEFVRFLAGKQPEAISEYQTVAAMAAEMESLARQYPNLAKRVEIGTSAEGRPIYALKISRDVNGDTADRQGILITGLHHAREWATGAIPMELARRLLAGADHDPAMSSRVGGLEIWLVPAQNPDGYTFSREKQSYWRKTRRVVYDTPCKPGTAQEQPTGTGVDANRNYDDPRRPEIRRPPGDRPCSTQDDSRSTSDDPTRDTYRGPLGNSEPETQAVLAFREAHPNLRGVIDLHSYGNYILTPWGHTRAAVENHDEYQRLGEAMNAATGSRFRVQPAVDLYPAYGVSTDYHHATGLLAYTLEMGQSFFPGGSALEQTINDGVAASLVFFDHFLDSASCG